MKKGILLLLAIFSIGFLNSKTVCYRQLLNRTNFRIFKNAEKEMKKDNNKKALELFNQIIESHPDHISTLKNIADIHYALKDECAEEEYRGALVLINQALEVEKNKKKIKLLEKYRITVTNRISVYTTGAFDEVRNAEQKASTEYENERDKVFTENAVVKEAIQEHSLEQEEQKDTLIDSETMVPDAGIDTESSMIITKTVLENNSISDEYSYNESDFASPWIEFESNIAEEQKKEIKAYIENNFFETIDNIENIKKEFINEKKYKDIIALNRSWMMENSLKDSDWLEELKTKEATYFDTLYKYNEVTRDLASDRLKLQTFKSTADNLKQQKENEISNLEIIDNIIDFVLVDEIESRLATIPQSIVLVGKISYANSDFDKIKLFLSDYMKDLARVKIKGFNVLKNKLSYSSEHERRILELFEIGFDGHAQTIDTFYKDLMKRDVNTNEYIYLIHRIEVFPFKESTGLAMVEDGNVSILSDIPKNVYGVNQVNLYEMTTNETVTFDSLNITDEDTKAYILSQKKFSDDRNKQYNNKINEVIKTYKEKLSKNYQKKEKIKVKVTNLEKQINEVEVKIKSLDDEIAIYRSNVSVDESNQNLYNRYITAKDSYERFYKTRIGVVNKLVYKVKNSTLHVTDLFYKQDYDQGYVDDIFSVRGDLEKNDKEISIYLEYKESGASEFSYKKKQARFKPAFKYFRILSIGANSEAELTHSLNIAFKVDWDFISPLCFSLQPPRIIDIDKQTQWLFLDSTLNPSSPQEYYSNLDDQLKFYKDEGWRLPTYEELMLIKGQLASEKRVGNDIFEKLDWQPSDVDLIDCNILTDKSYNDRGNKYVSYNIFNENMEQIILGRGIGCYLFLIKNCTQEDDCNCK